MSFTRPFHGAKTKREGRTLCEMYSCSASGAVYFREREIEL
jgi:hypothetical protein